MAGKPKTTPNPLPGSFPPPSSPSRPQSRGTPDASSRARLHHLHGSELAGKTACLSRLGIPLFASTGAEGNRYRCLPNCHVKWMVTWLWGF